MNKLIKFIFIAQVLIFAGCMSTGVRVGNESKKVTGVPGDHKQESGFLADNTVWVVRAGLKGDAGLFAGDKVQPIKSLRIDVDIIEFLASVDISVSYSQVDAQSELSFRYPAYQGMLVKDFVVKVGDRKFRAIISERESAEEIFNLAKKQGFNAVTVSQKTFSEMLVAISMGKKSDLVVDFSYSQLSAVSNDSRILALPEFKGLENSEFSLTVKGEFSSDLVSFTGLNKKVKGHKFLERIEDKNILENGLVLKYQTRSLTSLSSDNKIGLIWKADAQAYEMQSLKKGDKSLSCDAKILSPVYAYLHFQKMIKEGKPFQEIQNYAVQSRLITPVTQLLLVDSTK